MPIRRPEDVTAAVLAELQHAPDARLRELLAAAVRHLHAFATEVQLSEAEFQTVCALVAQLGQRSTASHNEVVLAAGSLGLSSLVCLLNNGGGAPTTANLLGPFWRDGSPPTPDGGSLVRSPTPGAALFVTAHVQDHAGQPVAGAMVDVWHSSDEGFYENQDPAQADMNLRGRLHTQADGSLRFRSIKPRGYPIPVDGPVGALLRAQGRHNMRPAHVHFLIHHADFKTQCSQVYLADDPHLDSDVQFAVTEALIGQVQRHDGGRPPAPDVVAPWYTLEHRFVVDRGTPRLPRPPITGKAEGERPTPTLLQRRESPR